MCRTILLLFPGLFACHPGMYPEDIPTTDAGYPSLPAQYVGSTLYNGNLTFGGEVTWDAASARLQMSGLALNGDVSVLNRARQGTWTASQP